MSLLSEPRELPPRLLLGPLCAESCDPSDNPDPINTKSANSVLPLAPEDKQIEKLGPTVDRVHGVGKHRADGSA